MARLKVSLCEITVYPFYQDWVQGRGTAISTSTLYATDLENLESLCRRAKLITRLNSYYGCTVVYNGKPVLSFINS